MSGPGFFSYGGISSEYIFRMLSDLQELTHKLSKIAAVKGGKEYSVGLECLRECDNRIKDIMPSKAGLHYTAPEIEIVGDEHRDNKFSI